MTDPAIQIHRELADIGAKLAFIMSEQVNAAAGRKAQYERQEMAERRMDSIDNKIADVVQKIESLDKRLKEMEPVTQDIGRWKERFIGMRMMIVFMSALFGGTVALAYKWILAKIGLLLS